MSSSSNSSSGAQPIVQPGLDVGEQVLALDRRVAAAGRAQEVGPAEEVLDVASAVVTHRVPFVGRLP